MAIGTGTAILIGAGVTAVGGIIAADKRSKASRQGPNVDSFIPTDIKDLRNTLAGIFDEDFLLGLDDELAQAVRSNQLDLLDPALREGILSGESALGALNTIGDAQRPVFQENLTNSLNALMSRFGVQGLRVGASSDLNRQATTQTARAEERFTADLLRLLPQIQSNQIAGFGAFSGNVNQIDALIRQQEAERLRTATGFATSFPNTEFNPLLGAPGGLSTAFTSAGQILSLVPQARTLNADDGID